ncbi:unnamed protein product [Adineta ricciae]|uniref:Uncharacterized protein n=1 Tax=Adineta ricciae TaxID=249248 RepID=A0A816CKN7_ADIRI|nr:unnamed protein product [Adineta ricciae]
MPSISHPTDYLFQSPCWKGNHPSLYDTNRYFQNSPTIPEYAFSPNEIDEILSRKLYNQLKITSSSQRQNLVGKSPSTMNVIDPELVMLVDRFFNLTFQNTVPMVNLLATAVATNFLCENIQELDKSLQEVQTSPVVSDVKRRTSLLCKSENDVDDGNLSWSSAPM